MITINVNLKFFSLVAKSAKKVKLHILKYNIDVIYI